MPRSPGNLKSSPSRKRSPSWPDVWFREQALKHVLSKMRLQSLSSPSSPPSESSEVTTVSSDATSILSDGLLLLILSKTNPSEYASISLVSKRWMRIHGGLVRSLKLTDLNFLESGRLILRFPNITEADTIQSCVRHESDSGITVTHKLVSGSTPLDSVSGANEHAFLDFLERDVINRGIRNLASAFPNLKRLVLFDATEESLLWVAEKCPTLQQLELHSCSDLSLRGTSRFENLQIVKLVGAVEGFYCSSSITDIGLTILAQACRRLLKLELVGCEGSYDGFKAVGQCCPMLEVLTICDHRMDSGWLSALSFCGNLKKLSLLYCKTMDSSPGEDEHLGACLTLEELRLEQCHVRDKESFRALLLVCEPVREISIVNCWGLDDESFMTLPICRRVKVLELVGCSLVTMAGLESSVLSWKEVERLRVVCCMSVRDGEMSPAMASLFVLLKELKWQPDSRPLLSSELRDLGVGKKGKRFFRRI